MKKDIFNLIPLCLSMLAIIFPYTTRAQDGNKIYAPTFQSSNTNSIVINAIERNDTATILYMDAYNRPNYWIRLASSLTLQGNQTGKTYKLTCADGFEIDKEVYMPESGYVTFSLQFPPLDPLEQTIDFIEGQSEDDFHISGISLNPEKYKHKIHCHLSGTVINRPQTNRLVLMKSQEANGITAWISIPVRNGKFEYDIYRDDEELYSLILGDQLMKGAWYTTDFFIENGSLTFTFYEKDGEETLIETSNPLTSQWKSLSAEINERFSDEELYKQAEALEAQGLFYSPAYQELLDRLGNDRVENNKIFEAMRQMEQNGQCFTPEGNAIENKIKELRTASKQWQKEWARQDNSLVGLTILANLATDPREANVSPYIEIFNETYRKQYPNHPASQKLIMLEENHRIEPGKPYIDFIAQDTEGNDIRISRLIEGKIALIDLWASWCGPCRRNSMQLIPIYQKYKERGFTIVGVARETGNAKRMEAAIKKDGYPWMNLVEIDDRNQIWAKYRIQNAAGGTYLIDDNGLILAVNPTPEEVERILKEKLPDGNAAF